MPLSLHTTLIIAVAGSVGGLLLVLILYRLLRRPTSTVPLPPKQELAHYREQHAHSVESRPATWYDAGKLSAPPSVGSRSSLIPPPSRGHSPFRRPSSLNFSESPSEDVSFDATAAPLPLVTPRHQPPHLSFDDSSTSLSTNNTTDSPSLSPPSASAATSDYSSSSLRHPSRSASSSTRAHPRRPRPLSVGSAGSSALSRQSRSTVRGVPHGPHSQVQIVLPAPLAFNDRMSIHESPKRYSVVDVWAPAAVRSETAPPIPMPAPMPMHPRPSSRPRRQSASQSSLPINSTAPQQPPAHRSVSRSRDFPPPVPQLPHQWLPPPVNLAPAVMEDTGRGRARNRSSSMAAAVATGTNERAPVPVRMDPPPPPPSSSKLQKQNRSRSRGR